VLHQPVELARLTGRIPEFLWSASDLFSGLLWAEQTDRSRSAKAASH
jgi:hypothetical protein